MVERRVCSFCGAEMEPGTGKLYVKKDGTVLTFDTNKCYKNMIELGRIPRTTAWTRSAKREKEIAIAAAAAKEGIVEEKNTEVKKVKAKKVKKGAKAPKKKIQVAEYDGPVEEPAAPVEESAEQPEEPVAAEEQTSEESTEKKE
ncbi:50S ribosomal protein L24e [Candidatus Methanomassiliicoccus intestinalis]|uniref:50S ribosomal protein L24e n=1 Tax=Candidatus Methanomassiliicoccus intestinalis TaxID=1406512 RepID=UPI0037DCDEEB